MTLLSLFGFIPSPSTNSISIGPLTLRMYGVMIGLGVAAAIWLSRRRWRDAGGDPDDIYTIAMWAVPAGLIGTRIYHVITDNQLYRGHWFDNPFDPNGQSPLAITKGGLGIPGGIIAGVLVGLWIVKRLGIRPSAALDMVAPAMPLAQAIGRWGNWWNQELFGGPSTLPWAVQIDPAHRGKYPNEATFHPTFLYESLWNIGVVLLIVWLTKKRVLRPGRLFVVYIGGYFLGRLWIEAMRSDSANTILGLRINIWISLLAIAGSLIVLFAFGLKRRPDDDYSPYLDGHVFDPDADAAAVESSDAAVDDLARASASSAAEGDSPRKPPDS